MFQAKDYFARFECLVDNPNIGVNSDELSPGLQRSRYGCHGVFLSVNTDNGILIVRVLGEEMDFDTIFLT